MLIHNINVFTINGNVSIFNWFLLIVCIFQGRFYIRIEISWLSFLDNQNVYYLIIYNGNILEYR